METHFVTQIKKSDTEWAHRSVCALMKQTNKSITQLFRGAASRWETSRCGGSQWGSDRRSSCRSSPGRHRSAQAAHLISPASSLPGRTDPPWPAASHHTRSANNQTHSHLQSWHYVTENLLKILQNWRNLLSEAHTLHFTLENLWMSPGLIICC